MQGLINSANYQISHYRISNRGCLAGHRVTFCTLPTCTNLDLLTAYYDDDVILSSSLLVATLQDIDRMSPLDVAVTVYAIDWSTVDVESGKAVFLIIRNQYRQQACMHHYTAVIHLGTRNESSFIRLARHNLIIWCN